MALALKKPQHLHDDDTTVDGTPVRYLPLDHVYSATSPCRVTASGSSALMSKKIKARKLLSTNLDDNTNLSSSSLPNKPPLLYVYTRRRKRLRQSLPNPSFFRSLISRDDEEFEAQESKVDTLLLNANQKKKKKHRLGSSELVKLGVDSSVLRSLDRPRLRDCRIHNSSNANVDANSSNLKKRKRNLENCEKVLSDSPTTKRWIRSVRVFGFTSYCFSNSRSNFEFEFGFEDLE